METKNQIPKNEQAITGSVLPSQDTNPQRLALSTCKKVLETGKMEYTDEEILVIRDFLYQLAGYVIEEYLLEQEGTKNVSNQLNYTKYEKGLFVRPGKYRRTGRKRLQPAASGRTVAAVLPIAKY